MIYILYIFLLAAFSISTYGQTANADILSSRLHVISVNEGLPQQAVTSIVQDKNGFVWMGTYDGLCKYDGTNYKNYYHINNDTTSLSNNRILAILEDSKGNLIVGTEGTSCVNFYNKDTDNFHVPTDIKWKNCRSLIEDNNHKIWVGTSDGLYLLHIDSLHKVVHEKTKIESLWHTTIKRILLSPDRSCIWILTNNKIYHLDTDQNIKGCYENQLIKQARDIYCDSSSQLFILHDEGIYLIDEGTVVKTNVSTPLTAIKELKRGIYIAGTENSGIRILESHQKGSFKIRKTTDLNNSTFFQSNLIRNFFIDRSNCLWIGSGHNGVAIVDLSPLPFHKLLMPKEEIRPLVRVITKDSSDNLWIGIKLGGLYMLKDGVYTKFPIDSKQNFNAIMEDSKKNIWILTNKNVYIYKGKKLYNLNEISGIPTDIYNKILAASVIIEDDQGTIWIGGTGKLARIRGLFTSSVSVHYFNAPYTQDIFCLGKDKLGRIWLGSRSKGIFVITLNIFSDIIKYQSINTTNSSIKSNHIWDICFSKNGNYVWVATDSGINSFDCSSLEANVISVAPHEKLINHKILSVIEVSDHSIWLNTSQGLLHYNPETGHYREYYYSDGLCSNCLTEAGYLAADGTLYIGSINGINYFNPLDIKDIRNDAQIQTIRFMIYNKSVKPNQKINSSVPLKCNIIDADQIDISYLNNNFSFEFIAPNYTSPNKIYYAYKLEGVDEDWVYTSSDNRIASYNNLDAGKYKFHVKATEINGIWNTDERCIELTVGEAPWNTWWAYLLYLIFVVMIILLVLKYYFTQYKLKRDLQIEHIQREHEQVLSETKLQFHANISHEIRTSLSLIITPLNDIINDIGGTVNTTKLGIMRRNIEHLNNLVSQFLDLQKIDEGVVPLCVKETNISLLLEDICERFRPVAENQQIEFHLVCESSDMIGYLDEDKVVKIIGNLVSNAIKFNSKGGRVTVFAAQVNDKIEFAVEDTGWGISPDDITRIFERYYQNNRQKNQGMGIGLSLVNQLVRLHKGSISVKSDPDGGQTLFTVRIPVSKEYYDDKELIKKENISPITREQINDNKQESKATIIIVEDNLDMSTYLTVCLAERFNVICKNNVDDAIDEIIQFIPDLILLDIVLEGNKTGYDLCNAVKSNMMTNHIPILMLSAKDTPQDIALGYDCGAEDYILKPFSMEILIQKINNIIKYRKNSLMEYDSGNEIENTDYNKGGNQFYEKLIGLIHDNISNSEFGITNICEELNISRTQLYRKVKAVTDIPISTLIRNLRMEKAYELFKNNDYTVSEVMYQVGINSNSYFTKTFKEYFNILPSEFIKQTYKK